MIRIGICDDEKESLEDTKKCLLRYKNAEIQIFGFHCGEELLKSEEKFDIIILDIDMEGLNGIETAKKIRDKDINVKIIYLTNYKDYTIDAFEVHAFSYLIKPINEENFHRQLDEALTYMIPKQEPILEFMTLDGMIRLPSSDIYYFEYINRKIYMYTFQGEFILSKKISQLAEEMKQYHFEMPHKSFSVNLYYVKSIKGYEIQMMDGSMVPLSQKKSAEFRKCLNKYLSL